MNNVVALPVRLELDEEMIAEALVEAVTTVGLAAFAYSLTTRAEADQQRLAA